MLTAASEDSDGWTEPVWIERFMSPTFRFECGFPVRLAFEDLKKKLTQYLFLQDLIIKILLVWPGLKIIKYFLHVYMEDNIGFPCQYKYIIGIQNCV